MTRSTSVSNRKAYLTKRTLVRATKKGGATLHTEAMRVKGYIVKAERNWVVKIDNSGRRQRLSRSHQISSNEQIALD
jgi:hypothetical protein